MYLLNSDVILEKYYKAIANRLRYSLGQRPKSDADKVRLHALVKYAVIEITPKYEWYAVEELRLSILVGDLKEISAYANIVAGQAVQNGWSSQALNDLLRFFRDDKTFDEQWNLFKETILNTEQKSHDVLIHIPFRNQRNGDDLDTLGILENLRLDIYTYEQLTTEYWEISDIGSLLNAEKRYFRVQVSAFDVYSAAHKAIRKISDLLNMASF